MADSSAPRPARNGLTRPRLSRELILERVIATIDDDGVSALTMRGVGSALGVEAISLYRYVNGREDLLEGVVEQLVGSIEVEPGTQMGPNNGWQAFLQRCAPDVRRLAQAHPAAFPLVATRHPAVQWLCPPLRSLRVVEAFLGGLRDRGFSDRQAVTAYGSFSSFLLGHLLLECAMRGAESSPRKNPSTKATRTSPTATGASGSVASQRWPGSSRS